MIGTTLNQRFSLEKELGRGGMGAVYRASDQVLGRTVAIKVLKDRGDDEVGKRIKLEARILARLLHDNVVRLYDFGESEGTCFLIMEEVDGTSYLKRWRDLPLIDRLKINAQVADALDYAHHQGVIHRDVKPANVLLTGTDQAKLSDFGLSMTTDHHDETGAIKGTPHYMSPEQAQGKRLDHRTDLYSLGIMLYESAAGSVPFMGKSLAVLSQHMNSTPEPPRVRNKEISSELEALILRLLSKDPDHRPGSAAAVAQLIRGEIEREQQRQGGVSTQVAPLSSGSRSGESQASAPTEAASAKSVGGNSKVETTIPSVSGSVSAVASKDRRAIVNGLLERVVAEPIVLTPAERFLCGHYLAYLLGGSRRKGIFMRRPLDPRNADRARLMLAMASICQGEATDEAIAMGAALLDQAIDVRPALSPVVVAKYLASRNTAAKRKKFRQARKRLLEASPYAQKNMTDINGVLNPGLMPATLDDLRKLAPEQIEVDDELVSRWNRVTEVWRNDPSFRNAVLVYATRNAARDPASYELWPEVVYPLIERARWQRQLRGRTEALWDNVCVRVLRVPDAGVRLDRAIRLAVPSQVLQQLDISLDAFEDEPLLEDEPGTVDSRNIQVDRLSVRFGKGGASFHELTAEGVAGEKDLVLLKSPDPYRFLLGDLRELWQEAIAAMRSPDPRSGHRLVQVGPYRLVVIPSIRGRSAGQVAIQGMPNKQIEMLTPSIRLGGSAGRPFVAIWVYQDNSLAIAYLDFKGSENYILWHAPNCQQANFSDPAALNHTLLNYGMEAPDQLDRALTKRFRPRNPA